MKNKKIISLLLLIFLLSSLSNFAQCPSEGDAKTEVDKKANRLQNRDCVVFAGDSISDVPIDSILKSGNDLARFNTNQIITIEGYILQLKYSGSESSNCHTKDKLKQDIQLNIGKNIDDKLTRSIVVKITPKYHERDRIKWESFNGQKVRITGYVFYDMEHLLNAVNTNPSGKNLNRATVIEIDPVVNIELAR